MIPNCVGGRISSLHGLSKMNPRDVVDNVLVHFSCVDGVVVDFKTLRDYCSKVPVSQDVRYIDNFHPDRSKYEYLIFKENAKFFPLRFLSTRFTAVNENVLDIFSKIDNVWDITSDFITKKILEIYKRLPELSIRSLGTLSDPCSFDFVSLMIAYKYIVILKKYKLSIREQLIRNRFPVLQTIIKEKQLDINKNGLQFYEWLQSLMKCYSNHNAKFLYTKRPFEDELVDIFVLPFVGKDLIAKTFEQSHENLEQSFNERTSDVDVTAEELKRMEIHLKTTRLGPSNKNSNMEVPGDVKEDQ